MSKLVYLRQWYENDMSYHEDEITHEKALDIVHGTYRDTDYINDMLLVPNRIPCVFSTIEICPKDKDGNLVRFPKDLLMEPNPDYDYDENWKRLN